MRLSPKENALDPREHWERAKEALYSAATVAQYPILRKSPKGWITSTLDGLLDACRSHPRRAYTMRRASQ